MPIKEWKKEYDQKAPDRWKETDPNMVKHVKCPSCKQELVVTRIVTACRDGHIDDFPWVKWVHCQNRNGAKPVCSHPKLRFKTTTSAKEGLEGITVSCDTCNATATLQGAFNPGKLKELDRLTDYQYNFKCTGRHPWKNTKEECDEYPQVLQRGASSVYFPVTESSLVIPPYSDVLTSKIEGSKALAEFQVLLDSRPSEPEYVEGFPKDIQKQMFEAQEKKWREKQLEDYSIKIAMEIGGVEKDTVQSILQRKITAETEEEETKSAIDYRYEEYEALTGKIKVKSGDSNDFKRKEENISEYGIPHINQIALIEKIREVQALIGFTRLAPAGKTEEDFLPGSIVSVKEPDTKWYPGYEVRGEGIFISFAEKDITNWIQNNPTVKERAKVINSNYKRSFFGENSKRIITPKFLMLHTMAHLLIKQLSFECGYSIASLKERIYCSDIPEKQMSGIFIYTASGDSEGTLGGLVRQGRADTFPAIFRKAVEAARLCSNDPVCSLSQGQGRDSLNLAACYSCALLPETSCEEFNGFLDRGVIVGTFDNPEIGFYYEQLNEPKKWKVELKNTKDSEDSSAVTLHVDYESGIDNKDRSLTEIWEDIGQWSENEKEKTLIQELLALVENMKASKSFSGCTVKMDDHNEEYSCDLAWPEKKILYFSADHEDDYNRLRQGDWTCYIGSDKALNAEMLLEKIKE